MTDDPLFPQFVANLAKARREKRSEAAKKGWQTRRKNLKKRHRTKG